MNTSFVLVLKSEKCTKQTIIFYCNTWRNKIPNLKVKAHKTIFYQILVL